MATIGSTEDNKMDTYILYGAKNGATLIFKSTDEPPNASHMGWIPVASGDLDYCHMAERIYQCGYGRGQDFEGSRKPAKKNCPHVICHRCDVGGNYILLLAFSRYRRSQYLLIILLYLIEYCGRKIAKTIHQNSRDMIYKLFLCYL